jgi:uncharacterized protein (DUF433 family)
MQKISLAQGDKVNWKAWFRVTTRGNLLAEVLAMVAVINSLIEMDEQGVPWISGANTKVVEVVLDKIAHNSSHEQVHEQYSHLSLAQIHAALSYYYEHQAEVDADIERRDRYVEELRAQQRNPLTRQELESRLRARDE